MSKTKKHRHKWEYDSDGRTYPFICQCGNVLDNGQIERILNGPKYVKVGTLDSVLNKLPLHTVLYEKVKP